MNGPTWGLCSHKDRLRGQAIMFHDYGTLLGLHLGQVSGMEQDHCYIGV